MEESGRGDGRWAYIWEAKREGAFCSLSTCITPAYLYGLENMAITKKQEEKLQVCENNWVRRIVRMKRMDKWRMEELREEVDKEPAKVGWACGKNGRGMVDALRVEGRRRGRPRLRWEKCMKRDLVGVGWEWRMKVRDGGSGEWGWGMEEWRMKVRDGGVENEGEGWGSGEWGWGMEEWRMKVRDGGVENEGEGWGSGEWRWGMGEWRMKVRDGGVENEGEGWGSGEWRWGMGEWRRVVQMKVKRDYWWRKKNLWQNSTFVRDFGLVLHMLASLNISRMSRLPLFHRTAHAFISRAG